MNLAPIAIGSVLALVLSITVYVIIDLEFPRLGMIKMSDSDAMLVPLRESMN